MKYKGLLCTLLALSCVFLAACSKNDSDGDFDFEETTAVTEEILPADLLAEVNIYDEEIQVADSLAKINKIGQIVPFGTYLQKVDAEEPIEWVVVDIDGTKALLLSRYVLDAKPYATDAENLSWDASSLREWLNSDFYGTAFATAKPSKSLVSRNLGNPGSVFRSLNGSNRPSRKED